MDDKDSKEKILHGATALFKKYGVRSITMDDIAHHLGISKKTIYQYFEDKDDIVTLAIQVYMNQERAMFEQVRREAKDAIHLMVNLNRCMKENMKDTNASLLYDLQKYHTKGWRLIQDFKYGFIRSTVIQNLEMGKAEGFFRHDINVAILSLMRLEQVTLAHNSALFPPDSYSLIEVQAQFFDHFINGILSEKGRKAYKKYKEDYEGVNSLL